MRRVATGSAMRFPAMRGLIDRRVLINFRIRPDVVAAVLPEPFEPHVVDGWTIAGFCLIRLRQVRPPGLPGFVGLRSENVAHRFSVTWPATGDGPTKGVYIPRRDTNSRLAALVGGRLFPGVHHRSRFTSVEGDGRYDIRVRSRDGDLDMQVEGDATDAWPQDSIFPDLQAASDYAEENWMGWSARRQEGTFDGLELRTPEWAVTPLAATTATSSWFSDEAVFPRGSIELDHALLMHRIGHSWHGHPTLKVSAVPRYRVADGAAVDPPAP